MTKQEKRLVRNCINKVRYASEHYAFIGSGKLSPFWMALKDSIRKLEILEIPADSRTNDQKQLLKSL